MATKSTRRSAAQSSSSTPQVPSSSTTATSPMTPTRLSRIQEKNALANLNDRFAALIEKNQHLENENQMYSKQITQFEETMSKTTSKLKKDYEKEVMNLRKTVDETAKDKNKLENENMVLKRDLDDYKNKFTQKQKDLANSQKLLNNLEAKAHDLETALAKTSSERDKLAADRKEFETENNRLQRELNDNRQRLEEESLGRAEALSRLQTKSDQLQFEMQRHEQEILEMRSRRTLEIQEVDGRLQQEYEAKLQESLRELRQEYETQLAYNKEELEGLFAQKTEDLKAQFERAQNSSRSKAEEISTLTIRIENMKSEIGKLENEKGALQRQIQELQKRIDDDHAKFAKMLEQRDAEIEGLVNQKAELMTEYQDLMDTKVALDNEIATYRKLLECEERRLKISPRHFARGDTPAGGRGTPLRARKRKFEEELSEAELQTDAFDSGDVAVLEDDFDGKYIKLLNKSEKELSLSGWTLTRTTPQGESTHKFHRQVKMEPNGIVTIWSSDAEGAVNEPPLNIVMKGQKWFAGESITTILFNNNKEEMAKRVTSRVQASRQRKRLGFGTAEELFHQAGTGEQSERCVIC